MNKKYLGITIVLLALTTSFASVAGLFANGTKGYWDVTSDPVLKYKSSLTLKFKMQDDYNFAQFNSFEIHIEDANTTQSINTTFLNECFTKTITKNSSSTEITVKLTSDTIYYQDAIDNGLDADIYYLWVDIRKLGDTSLALDTFKATPLKIKWDLNAMDLSTGGGWKPLSPELDYKSSVTLTFEGYQDQFEFKNEFPCSLNIMGLDTEIKQNYFHITDVTKVNNRTIRATITSTQIYPDDLLEKSIERKYYNAKVEFTDSNIPDKEFLIDLNNLPNYSTDGGTDYQSLVADLQAQIASLNAQITTLQGQTGSTTELTELRALRKTAISQLFEYGVANDSSNAFISTALATAVSDGKNWKQLGGLGYSTGSAMFTDFTTYKAQAQNPSCPTCTPCNDSNYVAKTTYDSVVTERDGYKAKASEYETQIVNMKNTQTGYIAGAGLVMLIIGIVAGAKLARPKNGNRPRPPVAPPVDQRLKPHRHKGGVPPQSTHVKKKELIGRD